MRRVHCQDRSRSATFTVECYALRSVALSASLPGEKLIIEGMIGTPIDPDLLADAQSVDEAISAIAINASNICCAALTHVYSTAVGSMIPHIVSSTLVPVRRAPIQDLPASSFSGGPVTIGGDEPVTLETLPAALILHIYCALGALRSAQALAATCQALRAPLCANGVALPVWDAVRPLMPGTVKYAEGTLHRSTRPGLGLVHAAGPLRNHSALFEVRVASGGTHGIALGVSAIRDGSGEVASTRLADQLWFEGTGKLLIGTDIARPTSMLPHGVGASEPLPSDTGTPRAYSYGDRLRQNDTVGLVFDARHHSVALTLRCGASLRLMGPWVPLRVPAPPLAGYRFCVRFDGSPCSSLAVDMSARAPADLEAMSRQPPMPPRPLPVDATGFTEPALLLRTIGPDSLYIPVDLDPRVATIGQLRARAAAALEVDHHQVALRLIQPHAAAGTLRDSRTEDALHDAPSELTLEQCGVRLEPNGAMLCTVYCSVPHLIS